MAPSDELEKKRMEVPSAFAWMLGKRLRSELTGWLVVARDMKKVRDAINNNNTNNKQLLGDDRKARQQGRTIATLKRGRIDNITGTFAFISILKGSGEDDGPLF